MRFVLRVCCALLICFASAGAAQEPDRLLQARLQAHISFLADDLLLGRQPGSAGYNIAANYVASQFRQMGLLPAGTGDTYFQPVPLRQALLEPGSAELIIKQGDKDTVLVFADHFYMGPSLGSLASDFEAGMIFVGYGIDALELGHSDYADINVQGKVVVLLAGQPHDFPSEEGAHFASTTEKTKAAVRGGAVGILMIHTPRAKERFQWDRMRSRVGKPAMGWTHPNGQVQGVFQQIRGGALINHTAAGVLFENAPVDLATILERDESGEALGSFDLESRIIMRQRSTHQNISSPNVVAMLPGSDPLLASEYVLYTAHLDHIGELHSDSKEEGYSDRINNGALDNASGISVMLETARLFAEGEPPRRSIMFLAVTAEEKGLVGSEYFAMNPTVPIESVVGVVNLDMPILLYDFGDVIAFGAEHSSMSDSVRRAAETYAVELSPDPFPEQNMFVRSDHYRFVQQGVPSVFLVTGMKSLDGKVDTQPVYESFLKEHYHKPSDDLNLPIDYGTAAKFTRINAKIGELIANNPSRPSWHEGDFFGRTFTK